MVWLALILGVCLILRARNTNQVELPVYQQGAMLAFLSPWVDLGRNLSVVGGDATCTPIKIEGPKRDFSGCLKKKGESKVCYYSKNGHKKRLQYCDYSSITRLLHSNHMTVRGKCGKLNPSTAHLNRLFTAYTLHVACRCRLQSALCPLYNMNHVNNVVDFYSFHLARIGVVQPNWEGP